MKLRAAVALSVLVALASAPLWASAGVQHVIVLFCYYAMLAQAWNLLAGYGGVVSFGQQAFVGLGGYGMAIAAEQLGVPVWLALVVGALAAGVVALPMGLLTFRLRGGYLAVGTWVMAEVLALLFASWELAGQATGLFIRPAREVSPLAVYAIGLLLAVGMLAGIVLLLRSRFGLALKAQRDNEAAAASTGVDVYRTKMLCFVLAAAGTGAAAGLIYIETPFIQPKDAFSINWVVAMSFMVVVGGLGTVLGPLVGAALYVALQHTLAEIGTVSLLVLGALTIVTMLVAPRGIVGTLEECLGIELIPIRRGLG